MGSTAKMFLENVEIDGNVMPRFSPCQILPEADPTSGDLTG